MLTEHRDAVEASRREWESILRRHKEERGDNTRRLQKISKFMRPAQPQDYLFWVHGYLALGGKITHHSDYNLPGDFFVALGSFCLPPLYGAMSRNVIVPAGLDVKPAGHCIVYRMDGFSCAPGRFVPMYNDIARMLG